MQKEIIIPEGVEATLEQPFVIIKGSLGEIRKKLHYAGISMKYDAKERKINLECISKRRNDVAVLGTMSSIINNMIQGVQNEFIFTMKCVFAHFPISVKAQGKEVQIQNFLGERKARKVAVPECVKVHVKGDDIELKGINKETVSQVAGRLENACYRGRRDPRKFQDGIYPIGWSNG